MTTGLVFGKFMPVHTGHLALIDFAVKQCDRLIVSMSYMPDDPIAPERRLAWLTELLAPYPTIELVAELDDFHDPTLPLYEATRLWAVFIKRRFPEVKVFFTSEEYGIPLAHHSGLRHVSFDPARQHVPVSATLIRQHPFQYWSYIPEAVRPYFVKKICLYGPESVGKTTMARQLAAEYETFFVAEVARDLITTNDFTIDDIIRIGYAQTKAVQEAERRANRVLFCDTDVITTQIYSDIYLHEIPPVLYDLERQVTYDAYVLLDIDVPWVADGLRDLGERRAEMFALFRHALAQRGQFYTLVSGSFPERLAKIRGITDQLLAKN
jgi:HTH-type transcriptional repressor of NAD biosynthesis genes